MQVYIAFLRGINVSGHNKILMKDLKQLFLNIGYSDVITYIQSGNVVFKSVLKDTDKIKSNIIEAIKNHFGYSINVLVRTKNDIDFIYNSNPFLVKNINADISKLCVTLLKHPPNKEEINLLNEYPNSSNDDFKIIHKYIFLHCPNGFGKTKLSNKFFEKKLKTTATSRNWKTITKLFELSNY